MKKYFIIATILLLSAGCQVKNAQIKNEAKLAVPGMPILDIASGDFETQQPYITISWNHNNGNLFNIYTSTDVAPWKKIGENIQFNQGLWIVPINTKMGYVRITATDGKGNESPPSPTASIVVDWTKHWKTYTDEKNGISFKYPEQWLVELSGSKVFIMDSQTKRAWDVYKKEHNLVYNGAEISLQKELKDLNLENKQNYLEFEKLNIAGKEWYKYKYKKDFLTYDKYDAQNPPREYYSTYASDKKYLWTFGFEPGIIKEGPELLISTFTITK